MRWKNWTRESFKSRWKTLLTFLAWRFATIRMRLSINFANIPTQKTLATIPTQKIRRLYLKQTLFSEKKLILSLLGPNFVLTNRTAHEILEPFADEFSK